MKFNYLKYTYHYGISRKKKQEKKSLKKHDEILVGKGFCFLQYILGIGLMMPTLGILINTSQLQNHKLLKIKSTYEEEKRCRCRFHKRSYW